MIRIELLSTENFSLDSLDNYQRKQDVKKVYRKHKEGYTLEECFYTEDWNIEKRRSVAKDISSDDYVTYLAIENDEVVGFIGLKKALVEPYMILDVMQVSADCRAEALYVSACSSEETIVFYKAMGLNWQTVQ